MIIYENRAVEKLLGRAPVYKTPRGKPKRLVAHNAWFRISSSVVKSRNLVMHVSAWNMVDSLSPSVLVWKGKVLNMYYISVKKA